MGSSTQATLPIAGPSNAPHAPAPPATTPTQYRTGRQEINYNELSSDSYELQQIHTDSEIDPPYGPAPPLIEYFGTRAIERASDPYKQQNIKSGEALSKAAKDEINRIAPHLDRCVITHLAGIDIEYCHMMQRATLLHTIRILEWVCGLLPRGLNVNDPRNIICMKSDIHPFVDKGCIIFLAELDSLVAIQKMSTWNMGCTEWQDRHRFDDAACYPLLAKKTYRYRLLSLNMPKNRVWPRVKLQGSKETGFTEVDGEFTNFSHPYDAPALQEIKSHVHPFFACVHACQQIHYLIDKDEEKWEPFFQHLITKDLVFDAVWRLFFFWFHDVPNKMPADFRHGFKSELRITPTIDSPLTNSVKNHNKKRKKSGKKQKAKAKTAPEPLTTEKLDKPTDPRLPLLSHICLLQVTSEDVEESVEKINALLLEIDSRSMLILDPVGRGRRSQTSSAHQSATTSQPPPARTLSQPSTERTKTISFTGNKILDNYPDSDSDAAGKKARKE